MRRKRLLPLLMAAAICVSAPAFADETTSAIEDTTTAKESEAPVTQEPTAEETEGDTEDTATDTSEEELQTEESTPEDTTPEQTEEQTEEPTPEETTPEETTTEEPKEPAFVPNTEPVTADPDAAVIVKERSPFEIFKEYGLNYDLTDKSEENVNRLYNQLAYDLDKYNSHADVTYYKDLDYGSFIVDMDAGAEDTVLIMTPVIADIDSANAFSGAAVMVYMSENWAEIKSCYNVRLIFFPQVYPYEYIKAAKASYTFGGIAGGDRLFVYDIAMDQASYSAARTAYTRNGTVFYSAPARFYTGVPSGLEGYQGTTYIERSLWWYENTSDINEYLGTRWYMSRSEEFNDTSGRITGFMLDAMQKMATAYGITVIETRLADTYNAFKSLLSDKDIFNVTTIPTDPLPTVTPTTKSDEIIMPTTPEPMTIAIYTEPDTTSAEETTTAPGGIYTPGSMKGSGISPVIYIVCVIAALIITLTAVHLIMKKKKGIGLIAWFKGGMEAAQKTREDEKKYNKAKQDDRPDF